MLKRAITDLILVKAVDPPTEAMEMSRVSVEKLRLWLKHCSDTHVVPDFENVIQSGY